MTVLERAASPTSATTSSCRSPSRGCGRAAVLRGSGRRSTHAQAPRLSGSRVEARRRSGGAGGAARLVAEASGRFQLQTQSDGPVSMLLVDFDAPSNLRALARFDKAALKALDAAATCSATGISPSPSSRTGLRPLSGRRRARGPGLGSGGARLFRAIRADPDAGAHRGRRDPDRGGRRSGAPAASSRNICRKRGRRRRADSRPGDAPEGVEPHETRGRRLDRGEGARRDHRRSRTARPDAVERAAALSVVPRARRARVSPTPLADVCRCSADRIDAMLRSFPPEEVKAMVGDDGMIGVTCEFCSIKRIFNPGTTAHKERGAMDEAASAKSPNRGRD